MKQLLTLLTITLLLTACGGDKSNKKSLDEIIDGGNVLEMRERHLEMAASADSLNTLIKRLEKAIAEKDTTKKHPLVTTFAVQDTLFQNFVSVQGSVDTRENILIFPEYQGVLTRVYVRAGQQVTKGQLLANIDDGGLSSQLAQLETQYELAKTTYERQQRLWDQQIGSEIQLLQAKTNMEATESNVKQLRAQLDKTSVRAPFSGVIDEIITEQGQVVAPGIQALMRLVNLNNMYVKASVPENYITSIAKGDVAFMEFAALGLQAEGKVVAVGNYINPSNRTFEIEVSVPNREKKIKPNLSATLKLSDYTNEKALVIPTNCIQENAAGDKFVYVLDNVKDNKAKAARVQIETGKSNDGLMEVRSGLEAGQIIVKDGALSLKDGTTVSVM